jgi:hypothetical protein
MRRDCCTSRTQPAQCPARCLSSGGMVNTAHSTPHTAHSRVQQARSDTSSQRNAQHAAYHLQWWWWVGVSVCVCGEGGGGR